MSNIKVGTILRETYGYSSMGNNFYVVETVSKSGKSVTLRKVGRKMVENHDGYAQCGKEVPDLEKDEGIVMKSKLTHIDGKLTDVKTVRKFKVDDNDTVGGRYYNMHIWDGEPCTFYCD